MLKKITLSLASLGLLCSFALLPAFAQGNMNGNMSNGNMSGGSMSGMHKRGGMHRRGHRRGHRKGHMHMESKM